jgi:hypothetical protein
MKECAPKIWEENFLWFKQIIENQFMQCRCLNWFTENVLCEQKKIKLWNKQHYVENKAEIMQHVLKMQ